MSVTKETAWQRIYVFPSSYVIFVFFVNFVAKI
jgi:hypothetical protein